MKKNTKKYIFFLIVVLILIVYLSQHKKVETFVLGQLRQRAQADNSGTCSPLNCNTNTLTSLTSQCSFLTNSNACGKSYINTSSGKIPCGWVDGVYDPINKTCGKNPNSAGGVCGTCF